MTEAMSVLVQEELAKLLDPGSTIEPSGSYQVDPVDKAYTFIVSTNRINFQYAALPAKYHHLADQINDYYFRVDVHYGEGWQAYALPWQKVYINNPYFSCRLLHSPRREDLVTLGEYRAFCGVTVVCDAMMWLVSDPNCQKGLADKIMAAMANYALTTQRLPDH